MPKPRVRKKDVTIRSKRKLQEQYRIRRLLFDDPGPPNRIYDGEVHPAEIVAFFKERYDQIEDASKFVTEKGQVGYTAKPVRPPTMAGYAASIMVRRETLWGWAKQHADFDEALGVCKAMQEALLVELGTIGALNASVTNFTLKNLQEWTDRVEETHKGNVALQFDAQDSEA